MLFVVGVRDGSAAVVPRRGGREPSVQLGKCAFGGARGDWTAGRMSPFGRGGNSNGFGEAAAAASQLHFEVDSKGRVKDSPRWSGKGAHGKHLERGNAMQRYDLSLLSVGFYRLHLSSILTF